MLWQPSWMNSVDSMAVNRFELMVIITCIFAQTFSLGDYYRKERLCVAIFRSPGERRVLRTVPGETWLIQCWHDVTVLLISSFRYRPSIRADCRQYYLWLLTQQLNWKRT